MTDIDWIEELADEFESFLIECGKLVETVWRIAKSMPAFLLSSVIVTFIYLAWVIRKLGSWKERLKESFVNFREKLEFRLIVVIVYVLSLLVSIVYGVLQVAKFTLEFYRKHTDSGS